MTGGAAPLEQFQSAGSLSPALSARTSVGTPSSRSATPDTRAARASAVFNVLQTPEASPPLASARRSDAYQEFWQTTWDRAAQLATQERVAALFPHADPRTTSAGVIQAGAHLPARNSAPAVISPTDNEDAGVFPEEIELLIGAFDQPAGARFGPDALKIATRKARAKGDLWVQEGVGLVLTFAMQFAERGLLQVVIRDGRLVDPVDKTKRLGEVGFYSWQCCGCWFVQWLVLCKSLQQ